MAPLRAAAATILLILAFHVGLSTSLLLKGSVFCSDCNPSHDFSGVRVAVKCSNQKMVSARTNESGYFELEVPANRSSSSSCFAVLLGGPEQLCALKRNMVSKMVKLEASDSYSLATSLTFFTTSCPSITEHQNNKKMVGNRSSPAIGTSKTVGPFAPGAPALPALPPFDFYRFIPIIGIP